MSEKDIIRIIEWAGFNRDPKEEISISYIQYLWGKKWEKANPGRPCLSDEAYISQLRY
uniref:Uncharacterized protein n=1 Tax=uncultured bacterium contig00004 TaxID=1181496 RepID=A0A806KEU8_9BACT|nr:hypothetical protein [uncultured bacterium contig00004]